MFSIRTANESDIPLIREMTFQVWPQTYAAILSPAQIDYMLEMMYSEKSLQKQVKEGVQFILIVEGKDEVGFAAYQQMNEHLFKLHKIYVLPSQQGKGTGRFLIDYIIADIRKKGGQVLQLQVNRYNMARYFYEKLGFSVKKEADFDIGNGYFMNDYIMEKNI